MATIKNIEITAKTRDNARAMAKKLGGKVVDNGVKSASRWTVKTDKTLKLKHKYRNLFKGVSTIDKVNVFTKQGYKMHLALTGKLI